MDAAWKSGTVTNEGEALRPDGICKASVVSKMKPIKMDDWRMDYLRFPRLTNRVWPDVFADEEGNLSYISVTDLTFKYKPLNREFYPVHRNDLLDMYFDMVTTNLVHKDQKIVKHLTCLHPVSCCSHQASWV